MKLFILTSEPFPYGMATINRIKCYAKACICKGVECEVVAYRRYCETIHTPEIPSKGKIEEIPYVYVGGKSIRKDKGLIDKIHSALDDIRTYIYLLTNLRKGDVVLGYSNTIFLFSLIVIWITHLRKAKYVYELCELPFFGDSETQKKSRVRNYKHLFPRCDGFIAISESLSAVAKQYCSKRALVVKIPILVDFKKYEMDDASKDAPYPYIFHAGTLTESKDGILGMIEAFCIASGQIGTDLHFISTGNVKKSPHCEQIMSIIEKYNKEDKVIFTGYIDEDQLSHYLSEASLTIINKYPTLQNEYCFSTKLGEYLAASKPVIITNVGEAVNWLQDGSDSVIVPHSNIHALSSAIVEILKDDDRRQSLGKSGKDTCCQKFDYSQQAQNLVEFLYDLSRTPNQSSSNL